MSGSPVYVEWAEVCEFVFLNAHQNPCLIGILNEIRSPELSWPGVYYIAKVCGQIGTVIDATLTVTGPTSSAAVHVPANSVTIHFPPSGFSYVVCGLVPFRVSEVGPYTFRLADRDGRLSHDTTIMIGRPSQPRTQPEEAAPARTH